MIDYILPFFFLASGITANKILLKTMSPGLLVGTRMFLAGIILLAVAFFHHGFTFWDKIKKHAWYLLFLAAFATFIPAILKAYALKHTLSSKVALIGSLDPFLTALYAYILFSEKLTLKKWIGIALGFVGSVLIVVIQNDAGCQIIGPLSCAELAALCSVMISRYGWIRVQQLLKAHVFTVKEINGLCMFIASIYSLVSTFFLAPETMRYSFDLGTLALLAYTIVGGNIIGYGLYSYALKHHSATFVALTGFSLPVFVYLFGWLFIGEQLYPSFLIAGAITFAGMLIFYQDDLAKAKKTNS